VEAVSVSVAPHRVYAWAGRAAESLFTVLFPSDCRICGQALINISRLPVCDLCLDQIHPISGRVCSVCGERVLSPYAIDIDRGNEPLVCPVCRRLSPPFTTAVAYGSYDGGLRGLIHLLKYSGIRPAANVLGRMLAEAISNGKPGGARDLAASKTVVIPVPLHKSKQRERSFNQAELVARAALKCVPVPEQYRLADNILQRQRDTHSQIGLTSHQRRENMRGAFTVARPKEVNGQDILLVDDVYTTGTTVSECARVLRRAGARRVWVATVARTLKLASKFADLNPPSEDDETDKSEEAPLAKAVGS
jgi:ComF family protein